MITELLLGIEPCRAQTLFTWSLRKKATTLYILLQFWTCSNSCNSSCISLSHTDCKRSFNVSSFQIFKIYTSNMVLFMAWSTPNQDSQTVTRYGLWHQIENLIGKNANLKSLHEWKKNRAGVLAYYHLAYVLNPVGYSETTIKIFKLWTVEYNVFYVDTLLASFNNYMAVIEIQWKKLHLYRPCDGRVGVFLNVSVRNIGYSDVKCMWNR